MTRDPRGRVQAEAARLLAAGVSGQVFPGAVACVARRDGEWRRVVVAAGLVAGGGGRVEARTPYDLGALTQAFVGASALLGAHRGEVDLGVRVESLLPHIKGGVLKEATLRCLMEHRAGLAPWGGLYLDVPHEPGSPAARRWILSEASRRAAEPNASQGASSDLGFLIAGEALAKARRLALPEVLRADLFEPLSIDDVRYAGALPTEQRRALAARAAPTERCEWRGRLLTGEVQDENAAALGGVAGHAGLFGTAEGVATLGCAIADGLAGRDGLFSAAALEPLARASEEPTRERFGFAAKRAGDASGRRMSARTVGQVGFPGTSLFVDPERDAVVVLLTNRICPSRVNTKIDGFRPAFHDGVMAALDT